MIAVLVPEGVVVELETFPSCVELRSRDHRKYSESVLAANTAPEPEDLRGRGVGVDLRT